MSSQAAIHCFRCGAPKRDHGPEMQCPCIVYTHEGRFITWNKCTFLGLEIVTGNKLSPSAASEEKGSPSNKGISAEILRAEPKS